MAAIGAGGGGGVATRGGIDDLVHVHGRSVADDGAHVIGGNLARPFRVERELLQFAAARQPVAADQRAQRRPRLAADLQSGGLHLVVDQPVEVARGVGIAGDRGGEAMALGELAERRGLLQVAGADDDPGIDRRVIEDRLQHGLDAHVARDPDQDRAAAAE